MYFRDYNPQKAYISEIIFFKNMNKWKSIFNLFICVFVCLSAGILGTIITSPNTLWFQNLNKPFFQPPNWLFGPVWTVLYILMGISIWLISKQGFKTKLNKQALYLFITQLVLNSLWSLVYFGMQQIFGALVLIILIWFFIFLTIICFKKINKIAALLLLPYLLWVSFATILNASLWYLN
jgi:tryptophan-rich sensory protein